MSKKSVEDCRRGNELVDTAVTQGAEEERQTGSHKIVRLPNGKYVSVPCHSHELGKGLRLKIVKAMLAAGLTVLAVWQFL